MSDVLTLLRKRCCTIYRDMMREMQMVQNMSCSEHMNYVSLKSLISHTQVCSSYLVIRREHLWPMYYRHSTTNFWQLLLVLTDPPASVYTYGAGCLYFTPCQQLKAVSCTGQRQWWWWWIHHAIVHCELLWICTSTHCLTVHTCTHTCSSSLLSLCMAWLTFLTGRGVEVAADLPSSCLCGSVSMVGGGCCCNPMVSKTTTAETVWRRVRGDAAVPYSQTTCSGECTCA